MSDLDTDAGESGQQRAWRDLGLRRRLQVDRTLRSVEASTAKAADDVALPAESLDRLVSAAWQAFMLERAAASMDQAIRRDSGGY